MDVTTVRRASKLALRCVLAVLAAGVATWVAYWGLHVNSSTAGFVYLLLILGLAARVGLAESIAASLASVVAYNFFFLPPIRTLTIADPENWVALTVFLITAITASQLSAQARRRAQDAAAREGEMQRMYEFSRALMLKDPERTVGSEATRKITELFEVGEAWFYDAESDRVTGSLGEGSPFTAEVLRQVARSGMEWGGNSGLAVVVPVGLGGRRLGSLGVTGARTPSRVALQAIAQLAAIAIETAHAQEAAARMEAARQNEQLKATLLDALAHEFKTPLTSIKAATTSLLPRSDLDGMGRELITIIDEEADRLNSLVSDAIELARIGREPVALKPAVWVADELISNALCQLRLLINDRTVERRVEEGLGGVYVDRKLTELVLRQLIGNAIKYSPPATPIQMGVERADGLARIRIRNAGQGIAKSEQGAVFEKFYRSKEARNRVAGTGMGLAIAREIVEAQGGKIWVESRPGEGAEFFFTLPFEQLEQNGESGILSG